MSFLVAVAYGIPSVVLYFLTIFIILRHHKAFGSSFFVLYLYDGAMNLFTYFLSFFQLRLSRVTCETCFLSPVYLNIGRFIPLNFLLAMGFHMAYVQYSLTTLISINRLNVLLNYNRTEPIWKRFSWLFVLIIYFAPFLNTHIVFLYESKMLYLHQLGAFSIESEKLPQEKIISVLTPFTALATFTSVIVNITSIVMVRQLKTQVRNKAEANFLVIMSITCAVQVLGTCTTVAFLNPLFTPFFGFLSMALPFVSDALSLVQPWLLVCFSHAIRQQLKMTVGWKPKNRGPTSQLFQLRSVTN